MKIKHFLLFCTMSLINLPSPWSCERTIEQEKSATCAPAASHSSALTPCRENFRTELFYRTVINRLAAGVCSVESAVKDYTESCRDERKREEEIKRQEAETQQKERIEQQQRIAQQAREKCKEDFALIVKKAYYTMEERQDESAEPYHCQEPLEAIKSKSIEALLHSMANLHSFWGSHFVSHCSFAPDLQVELKELGDLSLKVWLTVTYSWEPILDKNARGCQHLKKIWFEEFFDSPRSCSCTTSKKLIERLCSDFASHYQEPDFLLEGSRNALAGPEDSSIDCSLIGIFYAYRLASLTFKEYGDRYEKQGYIDQEEIIKIWGKTKRSFERAWYSDSRLVQSCVRLAEQVENLRCASFKDDGSPSAL